MPTFLYTGIDEQGYACMGARKAASQGEFESYLEGRSISDYTIFETRTDIGRGMYARVSRAELSIFCKQFQVLASAQLEIRECLELLALQSENSTMKIVLDEIQYIMNEGNSFATALSLYSHIFPANIIYMILIGEQSAALDKALLSLSEYYEKQAELEMRIRKAFTYPAMLVALMSIVALFLTFFVLPSFYEVLASMGHELSGAAVFMLGAGNALGIIIILAALLVATVLGGLVYFIKSGKFRAWSGLNGFKLNSTFTKYVYRRNLAAKAAQALSMLLRSGAGLPNAVEIVTPLMENDIVEERFINAAQDLSEGKDVRESFEQIGIFSPLFINMLVAGERTGTESEMIEKAGYISDEEAGAAVERIAGRIELVLTIILALIVGIMLLSITLPIIDLISTIG